MYKRGSSRESGIGSEESAEGCSAVRNFFDDFVTKLDSAVQRGRGLDMDIDDPTIDLGCIDRGIMAICPPSPIRHRQKDQQQRRITDHGNNHSNKQVARNIMEQSKDSHETFQVTEKRDPSLSELRVIVGQIKDKSSYGEKLAGIMLKGLEKTLTKGFFRLFVEDGLPENWCPIVKMNNDNTPFVEFLIKSEISDQDPFSQLNEYSAEHMALCKYVLNHLHSNATRSKVALQQQPQIVKNSKPSQTLNHQQLKVAMHCKENRTSLPTPMSCSTPLAQRKVQAKRSSTISRSPSKDSLNDSKRILPPRACKSGSTGVYKVS